MAQRTSTIAKLDWVSVLLYLLLVFMGLLSIYSSSYNPDNASIFSFQERYGKQVIWIGFALVLILIILFLDSKLFITFAFPAYFLGILLLVLVLLIGVEINNARSWFKIGSISIQPSEFSKVTTSLAVASFLSKINLSKTSIVNMILLFAIAFFPSALIVLQKDMGSALVYLAFFLVFFREGLTGRVLLFGFVAILIFIFSILFDKIFVLIAIVGAGFLAFYYLSGHKYFWAGLFIFIVITGFIWIAKRIFFFELDDYYVLLIGLVISGAVFAMFIFMKGINNGMVVLGFVLTLAIYTMSVNFMYNSALKPYQQDRIKVMLGLKSDPLGTGYNVHQSKIAIGSGGFTGKGFLNGTQTKFKFVPEQSTDFIFCTIGEEGGFIGGVLMLALFFALLVRLVVLAERQRTRFSRIYGYSVACIFFFHVIVNVGMTLGIAPVIGIPLPFISYGGSSLWAFTLLLFIFLKLDTNRKEMLTWSRE